MFPAVICLEPPSPPPPAIYRNFEGGCGSFLSWVSDPALPVVTVAYAVTSSSPQGCLPEVFIKIASTGTELGSLVIQPAESKSASVPSMLDDLKRMTGWSWERLAAALGRTRQALHGWITGREVSSANAERLAKLHATITYIDRGDAKANEALLISPVGGGRVLADLIDEGRYEEVRAIAGSGSSNDIDQLMKKADEVRRDHLARHGHWVDRLTTATGDEVPFETVSAPGAKRRVAVRRRD